MNNWIPKNKNLKLAVLSAFLSMALYFVGFLVVGKETQKVENFYHDSESEFSKNERLLAITSLTEKNKEPIRALRQFFIQKGDEVNFIEQIEQVARDSSIKFDIASIDVKSNPNDSFKEDIDVKMAIEGSWGDLMLFISKLEKMPFGVLIQSTSLKTKNAGEWLGFIELIVFREK